MVVLPLRRQRLHSTDMKLSHYYVCTPRKHSGMCVMCVFRIGGMLLRSRASWIWHPRVWYAFYFLYNKILCAVISFFCFFVSFCYCYYSWPSYIPPQSSIVTFSSHLALFYTNSDRKCAQNRDATTSARHGIHKLYNMLVAGVCLCVFVLYLYDVWWMVWETLCIVFEYILWIIC